MAVAVDPFSFATAELSEEYIGVFRHRDIVPKYLETVSDKTGVQLLTGCNTLSIKGSWLSLKRAHSFLTEFLASYQTAGLDQDEKDIELLDHSPSFSCDEDYDDDEYKPSPLPNSDARFHDSMGELSDWIKWTAEVLPQIQRTRSKRATVYAESKSQAKKVPEPLVLYASYQPTPDPGAKKPPTLDAIEKVLKKVYDKDKVVISRSLGASAEPENATCSKEVSNAQSTESRSKVCTALPDQSSVDISNQEPALSNALTDGKSDAYELQCDCDAENFSRPCTCTTSDITETGCNIATNASASTTQTEDSTAETVLPSQFPPSDNFQDIKVVTSDSTINNVNNQAAAAIVKSVSKTQLHRGKLSKLHGNEKQSEASEPASGERYVAEVDPGDQQLLVLADPDSKDKKIHLANRASRKTRRKGRPKKNEKYKKRKVDGQPEAPISSRPSRTERAAKRENTKGGKVEKSKPGREKKKQGRPVCPETETSDVKEEEEDYVFCELCSYVAKKLSHLREHKRRVHITKEFKCDKCGKIFGFGKDLKRHRQTHQKAENCCDICGKMYKGVRTLAEHKKTHETDYIKPEFPCEFCQKIFSTKYVLAYHIKSEHLGIKKTYLCPTCGKSFSQKNSYLQHANVHMGIRPYQCDTCGRSFSYEKSLKEHKYMHDDDKQFECHVCHKKFRQSSGVAIHMKIHKDHKDYVCSACGKGFSQKQALIRHERIHMGDKPFACALCRRTFTDSSILRRHMILIHKKDPKKWREDTENNVQRRTDFFISVVAEDGEVKKSEPACEFTDRESDPARVQASGDGQDAGDSCPSESAEDSLNFIPVGIGTISSPHPSTLPTVPPTSTTQGVEVSHVSSSSGAVASFTVQDHQADALSAVHKAQSQQTDTTLALSLGPALSKESTQPVDMSSHNQHSAQLQAQSSNLLNSYAYSSDPHRLPSSDCYTGEMQQQGAVSGLHLPQYVGELAQGGVNYPPAMVLLPDALNTLGFHSGAMGSTTAASHDFSSLLPPAPTQHQHQHQHYSDTQQH